MWCARDIVGDEPFALLLPDMVTQRGRAAAAASPNASKPTSDFGGNIVAVEEVSPEETAPVRHRRRSARTNGHAFEINGMVEKPPKGTAPSNLIISGRYILQPEIFDILETVEKGAGGEIQLTDGMIELAKRQFFHGVRFDGRTYDCGSKIGFLTANIAFALSRHDLAAGLKDELRKLGFVPKGARAAGPLVARPERRFWPRRAAVLRDPHDSRTEPAPCFRRSEPSTPNAAGSTRSTRRCAGSGKGGLGDAFPRAVETIAAARGRVIVTGMGKSGHVARKIAATLASTGTPALFVHAAEASHGDLGMITNGDVDAGAVLVGRDRRARRT